MVRRSAERRREVARQQLGDVAERARERQQRVRHQRLLADVRAAVPVRGHRGPSGEQRPDRSVVVRQRIVQGTVVRQQTRAPVSGDRGAAEVIELRLRAIVLHRAEPERHGRQHRILIDQPRIPERVESCLPRPAVGPGLGHPGG